VSDAPILLDVNVLLDIAGGHTNPAWALRRRLGLKTRVYIARVAYKQLVIDAPTKELGDQWRQLLRDAGIKIPPKTSMGSRVDLHQANIGTQDFPMNLDHPTGGIQQYRRKGGFEKLDKPGDAFIAAEAKALKARLWTHDVNFAKKANKLGVDIAQEVNLRPTTPRGPEDIGRAREYLGLNKPRLMARLNLKTRALRLVTGASAAAGAIKGGVRATGGAIIRSPVTGYLVNVGITIVLMFIQKWLDERMMKNKIKDGLKAAESQIDQKLNALKPEIAKLQLRLDPGEKVFANVTIQIHTYTWSTPAAKGGDEYNDWEVRLADVNVTTKDVNSHRTYNAELWHSGNGGKVPRKIDEYVTSYEVEVYSSDDLANFQDLQDEYLEYKRKAEMDPYDDIVAYELRHLREEIVNNFGAHVWFLDERSQ
jgi:predicted nucleic acid-binding protein